jgi:hypothetical protein
VIQLWGFVNTNEFQFNIFFHDEFSKSTLFFYEEKRNLNWSWFKFVVRLGRLINFLSFKFVLAQYGLVGIHSPSVSMVFEIDKHS